MRRSHLVTIGALCILTCRAAAAEHKVASAAELAAIGDSLRPGDAVVMADGGWADQAVVFRGKGTADQPITLRAAAPGKAVLSGKSSLAIDGEYLVVSGLLLKDATGNGDGISLKGNHCRLTETAVVDCAHKFFVHLRGTEHRVDHCYLAGKTSESPTLQVEVEESPNRHRIDHNHFGPRPPLGRNGGETIRVGYSGQSMRSSGTVVESNLFDRCDGELEIISNKSCDNVYRFNTFLDCAGTLTLRHGNRCRVEANFFLARHKAGSGGIRVIGEDHVIANNYLDGVEEGAAFRVTSGIVNSPLDGYFQARRCVIAFNTAVDCRGPAVELDAGFGTSNRTLRPERITIANNVFAVREGPLLKGKEGEGFRWGGNVAAPTPRDAQSPHDGIRLADPKLSRAKDGLWRPAPDSAARGAAVEGIFPGVATDVDGQAREGRLDAGCDQIADGPVTNRPPAATDVGASWMERGAAGPEKP